MLVNSVVTNILKIEFKKDGDWAMVLAFYLRPAHFRTRLESLMSAMIEYWEGIYSAFPLTLASGGPNFKDEFHFMLPKSAPQQPS